MDEITNTSASKKDNRPIYKKKRFIIPVGLIVLSIISSVFEKDNSSNTDTEVNNSISTSPEGKTVNEIELTKEKLKKELTSFEKPFDNSPYDGTIESAQMALILFAAYSDIIKEGISSSDDENKKLADQLSKKVKERQVKEFPILRKRYAEIAGQKLWENDVYVSTNGSDNSIINFTGGMFATNKNIAETQKTLSDLLNQFRFKEVRYRWYKDADEYTSYKMTTPKDSEPVVFEQ